MNPSERTKTRILRKQALTHGGAGIHKRRNNRCQRRKIKQDLRKEI